jgi:BA14K-like protein
MTVKIAASAMAIALLCGTAALPVPAAAQTALQAPGYAKTSSIHTKRLFLSADSVYDAGLRRGRANSSRNAYLRGFRDGTSTGAYNSRVYVANPNSGYAIAPAAGYSLYDRAPSYAPPSGGYAPDGVRPVLYDNGFASDRYDAGYAPATGGYLPDGVRPVLYDNGFVSDRYDAGYAPRGLMNVAVAPVAIAPSSEVRAAHWSYCTARYATFDPASDTFLATDGNRYYCR